MEVALKQSSKWGLRAAIFIVLIVPLYVLPSLGRAFLVGPIGWGVGLVLSDVLGSIFVGLVTNNYRLGILLYLGSTALELVLIALGHHTTVALLIGDFVPAVVGIYFAQQLFVNMGD